MDSHEQRTFFEQQGYLIVPDLLNSREVAECQREVQRLHQLAVDLEANQDPLSSHFQREPFSKDQSRNGLPVLRKIENTRALSPYFAQLAAHPRLVAIVQSLLGDDLLLFRSTLMLKPAFHGSAHALHQDSAYWPMEPPALVTVSIALDDANPDNGCIKIIPGSHHWGLQEWGHIAQKQGAPLTNREDIDTRTRSTCRLRPGPPCCSTA